MARRIKVTKKYALAKFGVGLMDEDQISKMEFPEGACIDCQNVIWVPSGAMTKRQGLSKLHSTAWKSAAITNLVPWESSTGASYTLAFSCASGASSASIATVTISGTSAAFTDISDATADWDPEITDPISVTSMIGSAAMTHWGNSVAIYGWSEGITMSPYAASPSGAKVVVGFGNYLFACNVQDSIGVQQRSRIQWCASRNPDSWPSSYYMDLDVEDGDEITAAVVFQNKLVVFKKYKTYVVYWTGGESLFTSELIDNGIGCVGPNAAVEYNGILYFIGADSLYSFNGVSVPTRLSDKIQSTFNTINMEVAQTFDVVPNVLGWEIWFNVAVSTSTTKNLILAYDTRFKSFTKFDIAAPCTSTIYFGTNLQYQHFPNSYSTYTLRIRDAAGNRAGILCIGTYDGYVARFGLENNDYGEAINGYWVSKWLDFGDHAVNRPFGDPTANKRIIRITVLLERSGDYDLNFYLYTDWDDETPVLTKTLSLAGGLDSGLVEKKIDFTYPFRACQIKMATAETSTPFIVHRIVIDYLTKGHTFVVQ